MGALDSTSAPLADAWKGIMTGRSLTQAEKLAQEFYQYLADPIHKAEPLSGYTDAAASALYKAGSAIPSATRLLGPLGGVPRAAYSMIPAAGNLLQKTQSWLIPGLLNLLENSNSNNSQQPQQQYRQ